MKILPLLIVCLALSATARGECDCTKAPFKPDPPCSDVCIPKTLARANGLQLVSILALPESVSKKIMEYPKRTSATSLEQYKNVLTPGEITIVRTKFWKLTQPQLDRFYNTKASNRR